ncbi:hypothetical protein CRI93_09890 [Longimonas halophila]|uniref:Copper resistance protein D domain-containing protein n=1 Tax=Longimonas halophila TaxID=1469170 RepID=A0A2H3NKP8_9BACT|nr:hypothetical protein [Longimonas halophila]PEN06580.1 hypothetical protein CRI93_09890 [Longimonas halophila]
MLKTVLVVLHIVTASAWFGLGLRLASKARTVLSLDGPAAAALAEDARSTVKWMSGFIVLTMVFAYANFFLSGGFAAYGPQFHAALTLMLVLVGVQFFMIRPGWNTLADLVGNGTAPTSDAADGARKKVAIGTGIGHLLWMVLLVLMYFNQLIRPFFG